MNVQEERGKGNPYDKCARKARVNPAGVAWAGAGRKISMTLEHGDQTSSTFLPLSLYSHTLAGKQGNNEGARVPGTGLGVVFLYCLGSLQGSS